MEPSTEKRRESSMSKTRKSSEEFLGDTLQAKMVELIMTQDELKKARDSAVESWLDSAPFIDELEKLQSGLSSAKNRTSVSNIVISELESQMEDSRKELRTKKEEELKVSKLTNELTQALDQAREDLRTVKRLRDEERVDRSSLKLVLRMRKQTLKTLQLTLRATRLEAEAFAASAASAIQIINISETESAMIEHSREEYYPLKKRAKDEEALAEWRINVSMEQKLAAEARRNLVLTRLRGLKSDGSSMRTVNNEKPMEDEGHEHAIVEEEKKLEEEIIEIVVPKAQTRSNAISNGRNTFRKTRSRNNSGKRLQQKKQKKKKASIFSQLKSFLVRIISKLFK
ncbi:hypothetical protein K2173_021442 [Erythroxylum novogranatense]|uniref:WEB family protein n=1 Tax=Erythroxylum novogranatense TaxID=1862640 RepID=A0AAV8TXA0_9ROSI|nr:hypothetical protein K2173_021442 [Erythroxylum novogranatense]